MYFNINDTMLREVCFSDISLMLRNTRQEDMGFFENEVREMLMSNVEDAIFEMNQHWEEIVRDAFPDEEELPNALGWDSDRLQRIATDIYECLKKHGAWVDVSIYYDGKRMTTCEARNGKNVYRYNGEPFIQEGYDPRDYFEYAANPHILSMVFEGPFYDAVNYGADCELFDDFQGVLSKYDVWFELGNAWNLTLYES